MRRAILWVLVLLCAVALLVGDSTGIVGQELTFARRVAERCKGEAAFAIAPCACVVRNRLAAGWSETNVLTAFYAADVAALDSEVWLAERVLTGYWPCDPRLYFMFSAGDCRRLALIEEAALLVVKRDGWRVLFYARDALND